MYTRKLKEFYQIIERNRNRHYGREMGREPVEYRNAMISYLINNIPEGAVWLDLFAGDGVVPLALLYLQKHGLAPKIKELWVADDNSDKGFPLVKINAESLAIKTPIIQITTDLDSPFWGKEINGCADIATLIDSANYIRCPLLFFEQLKEKSPLVHILQVGEFSQSFLEDLKNSYSIKEDGFIFAGEKGLNYLLAEKKL